MTSDRDLEQEVIIQWDRASDEAVLFTADASEARRWGRLGYAVEPVGRTRVGTVRSWQARVPVAAIALLPVKAGQVRAPRWLEPPSLSGPCRKGPGAARPGKSRRKY